MGKIAVYVNTIKYLKFEQLWYQVWKRLGMGCPLIRNYKPSLDIGKIKFIQPIETLDYDEVFLNRFSVEELMENKITLLHSTEKLDLDGNWFFESRSPLWNHNLHYFEYLFALAKAYKDKHDERYISKIKEYIVSWINNNPIGSKNSAWECYPIALRVSNWIELYALLRNEFNEDEAFKKILINSLFVQYNYLLNHLEKHLLANHYFEDLRTLVIASAFFDDDRVCKLATQKLLEQCKEQVFPDGMHFERSPMYQKILIEDLIRVENALEFIGNKNEGIKAYIKKMLDVSYSLEEGLDRLPLFNDCGKNISKSLQALVHASLKLGVNVEKKTTFTDSGYYVFDIGEDHEWRMIVDAGRPGPDYSPGHAHCELMSYELFYKGKPMIVNSGTYAYQCDQRQYYKSTEASNTARIAGVEQSECWGSFRMARRAKVDGIENNDNCIKIKMINYKGDSLLRTITFQSNRIIVVDDSKEKTIESYIHINDGVPNEVISVMRGEKEIYQTPYSEEFGAQKMIRALKISGPSICYSISIKEVQ